MKAQSKDILAHRSIFGWIAVVTVSVLLVPLVAMRFSQDVNWSLSDFTIMGTLLFSTASLFVHVARRTPKRFRPALVIAFLLVLLYVWAELAVGVFTHLGS